VVRGWNPLLGYVENKLQKFVSKFVSLNLGKVLLALFFTLCSFPDLVLLEKYRKIKNFLNCLGISGNA
jgi:hypothetical protein